MVVLVQYHILLELINNMISLLPYDLRFRTFVEFGLMILWVPSLMQVGEFANCLIEAKNELQNK